MASKRELKEQNPKFVIDIIEILAKNDPTKTHKYLPFMISTLEKYITVLVEELENVTLKELFEVVTEFEEYSNKNILKNKDIYSYKSTKDIKKVLKEAKEHVSKGEIKTKETIRLYEDDKWLVLIPLTTRSSNMYGRCTKWCVSTTESHGDYKQHFKRYTETGLLIFIINKEFDEEESRRDPLSRVAYHMEYSGKGELTIWDATDKQLDAMRVMELITSVIPTEVTQEIKKQIDQKKSVKELAKERKIKLE